MLGRRSAQRGLFEADTLLADFVGQRTFYGFLASQRDELFRDEDFAALYCRDNGRPSVPPSLLATALVLQTYDGVSDDEAKQRADYDLRWKVALGIEVETRPFAKSTLQEFRAQLIVHEQTRALFQRTLELAKRRGVWKKGQPPHERQHIKVALDTTHILGRGAVKDTYNLLADGIIHHGLGWWGLMHSGFHKIGNAVMVRIQFTHGLFVLGADLWRQLIKVVIGLTIHQNLSRGDNFGVAS